ESHLRREITLVIDRSGSMEGEKIEQARRAARQVIAGLEHGEAFNIITYADDVEFYADEPVVKSRTTALDAGKYIDSINARGGTNLHEALKTSLQPEPDAERLPIVLFLTDGLPTVGEVNEHAIRGLAKDQNPHEKRIFTFGVGVDVNTPLLDKLATTTRAFATFVLPGQDVETSVSKVFRGLDGPSLASPVLNVLNRRGRNAPSRVSDILPSTLPDMYEGDQMVILGRYRGNKPLVFRVTGNYYGEERTFERTFSPRESASSDRPTDFVARLWASRKIAQLIDTIRDMGGEQMTATQTSDASTFTNASATTEARLKELTDEIVRLSTEFGILTEYTSFLATQGVDMSNEEQVSAEAMENLRIRAFTCRSGEGSVNQELNNSMQRNQRWCNTGNFYWDANMQQSAIVTVQQCNTRSLYRRGDRWISSELVADEDSVEPDRTVEFGSDEFLQLLWQLVAANRNSELALEGDILLTVNDETILIKAPPRPEPESDENSTPDESSDQ
ncbi:MAG: vWA domain-containing protein, partial [Pirellulaceae bacterium]